MITSGVLLSGEFLTFSYT